MGTKTASIDLKINIFLAFYSNECRQRAITLRHNLHWDKDTTSIVRHSQHIGCRIISCCYLLLKRISQQKKWTGSTRNAGAYLNPANTLDKHLRTMPAQSKQISRNINKRSGHCWNLWPRSWRVHTLIPARSCPDNRFVTYCPAADWHFYL